jgi:hypothetical protein
MTSPEVPAHSSDSRSSQLATHSTVRPAWQAAGHSSQQELWERCARCHAAAQSVRPLSSLTTQRLPTLTEISHRGRRAARQQHGQHQGGRGAHLGSSQGSGQRSASGGRCLGGRVCYAVSCGVAEGQGLRPVCTHM